MKRKKKSIYEQRDWRVKTTCIPVFSRHTFRYEKREREGERDKNRTLREKVQNSEDLFTGLFTGLFIGDTGVAICSILFKRSSSILLIEAVDVLLYMEQTRVKPPEPNERSIWFARRQLLRTGMSFKESVSRFVPKKVVEEAEEECRGQGSKRASKRYSTLLLLYHRLSS